MLSSKITKVYSKISGFGIKAQELINPGELLIKFAGDKITVSEANFLYDSGFDYILQISNEEFLLLEEDSKYVNHSCSPNSAFLNQNGELVALREIKVGEEITFDYSANENTEFKLICRCGSSNCRGEIIPYEKNSNEVRQNLQKILSPYLKNQKQT